MNEMLKLENQLCFPLYPYANEVVRRYTPLLEPLGLTYTQYMAMMMIQTINAKGKELLNYGNFQMFKLPDEVKHDASPTSFVGRFWRWHINFCLGWKAYFNNLSAGQGMDMADFPGLPSAFTASFYSGLGPMLLLSAGRFLLNSRRIVSL